jgi:hypothetical protein
LNGDDSRFGSAAILLWPVCAALRHINQSAPMRADTLLRASSAPASVGKTSTDNSAAPTSAAARCEEMACVCTPISVMTTTSDNEPTAEYSANGARS